MEQFLSELSDVAGYMIGASIVICIVLAVLFGLVVLLPANIAKRASWFLAVVASIPAVFITLSLSGSGGGPDPDVGHLGSILFLFTFIVAIQAFGLRWLIFGRKS